MATPHIHPETETIHHPDLCDLLFCTFSSVVPSWIPRYELVTGSEYDIAVGATVQRYELLEIHRDSTAHTTTLEVRFFETQRRILIDTLDIRGITRVLESASR